MNISLEDILLPAKINVIITAVLLLLGLYWTIDITTTLYVPLNRINEEAALFFLTCRILAALALLGGLGGVITSSGFIFAARIANSHLEPTPVDRSFHLVLIASLIVPAVLELAVALGVKHSRRLFLSSLNLPDSKDPHTIFTRRCYACRITVWCLLFAHVAATLCCWIAIIWTEWEILWALLCVAGGPSVLWSGVMMWQHWGSKKEMYDGGLREIDVSKVNAGYDGADEKVGSLDKRIQMEVGQVECRFGTSG